MSYNKKSNNRPYEKLGLLFYSFRENMTPRANSQVEIAQKLHLNRDTYCRYECGRQKPSIENLLKIGDFYGIPITELLALAYPEYTGYIHSSPANIIPSYICEEINATINMDNILTLNSEQRAFEYALLLLKRNSQLSKS